MAIKKVGVLGCGLMGCRIAQISAAAGYDTIVREVKQEFLDKGFSIVEKSLVKNVEKEKMTAEEKDALMGRLSGTLELEDLKDCDLIIEAVIEDINIKNDMFRTLDEVCPENTIFTSNTSSLAIIEMAAATKRPDRMAGLHFFNPAHAMKLVEIIKTVATNKETIVELMDFSKKIGKVPVLAKDKCGFIVNRLLIPYLLDAIRVYEEGLASAVDIDNSMKLGCAHPMGPLTLADFVGLDTTCKIANIMFEEFREARFAPPPLLKKMIMAGYLGMKSGKGFYDYSDRANPVPSDLGL